MPAVHRIELTPAARRDLAALPRDAQARIDARIMGLAHDPRPAGAVRLRGPDRWYRIRAGDYRVIYEVHDRVLLVLVVRVGHRREVYRP